MQHVRVQGGKSGKKLLDQRVVDVQMVASRDLRAELLAPLSRWDVENELARSEMTASGVGEMHDSTRKSNTTR